MVTIDCNNLISEMAKRGITPHEVALLLDINDESITSKMQGSAEWIYEEVILIRDTLFPDCELAYLFRPVNLR